MGSCSKPYISMEKSSLSYAATSRGFDIKARISGEKLARISGGRSPAWPHSNSGKALLIHATTSSRPPSGLGSGRPAA
jgi:hypothetical protein